MFNKVFLLLSKQNIIKNFKQFTLVVLILMISMLMFTSLVIPMFSLSHKLEQLNQTQNLEDFNFKTYKPIVASDLNILKKRYNMEIEENNSKIFLQKNENWQSYLPLPQQLNLVVNSKIGFTTINPASNQYVLIVNKVNSVINKSVVAHKLKDNEIAVDQATYIQRGYNEASIINLNAKKFKVVSGIFVNYLYPVENLLLPNTRIMALSVVNANVFNQLNAKYTNFSYQGKFKDNLNLNHKSRIYQKMYNDKLLKKYIIIKITDKLNNPNIAVAQQKIIGSQYFILVLVIFMSLLAIFIVISVINKLVTSDVEIIGVLKALGYNFSQISSIYIYFPIVAFICASIVTLFLSPYLSNELLKLYQKFFLIPKISITQNFILDIFYLTIILMLLIFTTKYKLSKILKQPTLDLLNQVSKHKVLTPNVSKYKQKNNFIKQIRYLNFIYNKSTFIYFICSTLLVSFLINFSLLILPIYNEFTNNDNKYIQTNQQIFKTKQIQKNEDGEYNVLSLLLTKTKTQNQSALVTIWGLNHKHPNILFTTPAKAKLEMNNKSIFISNKLALFYNLKINDQLEVVSVDKNLKVNLKITGITQLKDSLAIYTSNQYFNELFNEGKAEIMGRYTNKHSHLSQLQTINYKEVEKFNDVFKIIQLWSLLIILLLTILISITIIFVAFNNLIFKNKTLIEVMYLLGYKTSQIKTIVLQPFLVVTLVIGVFTYPVLITVLNYVFASNVQAFNLVINLPFNISTWIGGYVVYLISYMLFALLSTYNLQQHIGKND